MRAFSCLYETHHVSARILLTPTPGHPRPVGQLASDRIVGGRQHVRRRDDWHGTHHPARPGRSRIRNHVQDRRRLIHRHFRSGQGRLQPARRTHRPTVHPPPDPHRRLDDRHTGPPAAHLGASLGMDHRRQPAIGRKPGPCLVNDRQHEDRSGRPAMARAGAGIQ